ncbi:Uncharacterised protein [Vibrio cholerae]|uniref:Uncharacterized protein n=2 Tax=Vibrio cholerae TaxID=666 RepID=A0A655Q8E4_VIBCL|nr:Uncharacterised protein [Vibrio cholerae]CSC77640.1 Uncharacterised protein [Vibrio cholerae]CSC87369.1 Uncharacterised protein [Vibrio cholerae]
MPISGNSIGSFCAMAGRHGAAMHRHNRVRVGKNFIMAVHTPSLSACKTYPMSIGFLIWRSSSEFPVKIDHPLTPIRCNPERKPIQCATYIKD